MKKAMMLAILTLVAVPIFAEWVPPRLIEGVWVTAGVTDEQAKQYAQKWEAEKIAAQQEQARWQEYYWQQWQVQRAEREREIVDLSRTSYLEGFYAWADYEGLRQGLQSGGMGFSIQELYWDDYMKWLLARPDKPVSEGGGIFISGPNYNGWLELPKGAPPDALAAPGFVGPATNYFPPTMYSGPSIEGMSIWDYADREQRNYLWETGQYKYPDWVETTK